MLPDIVIPASIWQALRTHLIRVTSENPNPPEEFAFLFASLNDTPFGLRLIVHEMVPAAHSDIEYQSSGGLGIKQEFMTRALRHCGEEGWSLIHTHSHPFDTSVHTTFSETDWSTYRG